MSVWYRFFRYLLRNLIQSGFLVVELPDGSIAQAGTVGERPINIKIHNEKALRRLCLHPDMALGECYMNEELTIENDDLHGFLELMVRNDSRTHHLLSRRIALVVRKVMRAVAQFNPGGRARRNVAHHYDLSDELYELFLDADLQYSCAYFKSPDDSLDLAQQQKKAHIAQKLLLKPGMRVLDIGSGWGGLGLTLARDHGCNVEGITLATNQHRVSNRRAVNEGLASQVRFSLLDYREMNQKFDRIVSVGMFEHVGTPHYPRYFRKLKELLNDDGVALLHTIGRAGPPGATNPWIAKYIFPGGYIPALSETMAVIEKTGLRVTDVEVWRLHYADTLAHWYLRFMNNFDRAQEIYDERFCRMWRFYLVACEMVFRHGQQVVFQIQITKRQDAVPLTRDYVYQQPKTNT